MTMTRRRVTIREVARAAGVSTQTVSRVLNDRPDVAPDTFERVRAGHRDHGLPPNMLARGLTQGRTHILGVVAYGLDYFGPSRILTGIEQQAATMGYSISLTLIHRPETGRRRGPAPRASRRARWTASSGPSRRSQTTALAADADARTCRSRSSSWAALPGEWAVALDRHRQPRHRPARHEHLLAGGARRVGIVTGPMDWWEAQQRIAGWRDTLVAAGIPPSDELVVRGRLDAFERRGRALPAASTRVPDIDAVFASNDQMALGVLHAAHRLGPTRSRRAVRRGVDDIAEGSHFWPPLTTVHQPLRDAGALAVADLDQMIRIARQPGRVVEEPPDPSNLLSPELIVRSSSRPVPEA